MNAWSPEENVVEIRHLARRFKAKVALNDVSLDVPAGTVMGLVGPNGAGKTTLIKHILGSLKAQAGTVRVFGENPVADPAGVLSRIGYLSEESDLPEWMKVHELMRYCRAFYRDWNQEYAESLRLQFDLNPNAVIRNLSKGQRARVGLLAALAYRPALLLLDEPSSGLDPIVRRDILQAIVKTISDEGRTVLFSSHLLEEVERMSDRITMISAGRIAFSGTMEEIRSGHSRVTLRFDDPVSEPPSLEGALAWSGEGREWTVIWSGSLSRLERAAIEHRARLLDPSSPSLNEIFVARATVADPMKVK